jgi:hypothetical protein
MTLRVMAKVSYSSQSIQLPLFLLHIVIKLLDTLKGRLVSLNKRPRGLAGNLKSLKRYVSIEHPSLNFLWKKLENIIDLHKVKT